MMLSVEGMTGDFFLLFILHYFFNFFSKYMCYVNIKHTSVKNEKS